MSTSRPALLVCVSDTHCGSTLGLCEPGGVDLDDGGRYSPSVGQRWMWSRWLEFVATAKHAAEGRRVYLILNGDLIDGTNHDTTQTVSANLDTQRRIARDALAPLVSLADRLFVVRGTPAHTGPVGQHEETLAAWWGTDDGGGAAVRSHSGPWSWWDLRVEIAGVLVEAEHHCSAGNRAWTVGGAAVRIAIEAIIEARRLREREPDLLLRSHVHRYHDSGEQVQPTRCIITPAWQLRTEYARRKAIQPADVGGVLAHCHAGAITWWSVPRYAPPRTTYWRDDDAEKKPRSKRTCEPGKK